jgi:hypothetical protein
MEETPEIQEDLGNGGKFKNWLQDNVRIILSVLIVVAIAAGIYSYSKRTESPMALEEVALEEAGQQGNQDAVTIIGDEDNTDEMTEENQDAVQMDEAQGAAQPEEAEPVQVNEDSSNNQVSMSEETGEAFVQTAAAGDSLTTLSRKSLQNYLEKNNDSSLTAEHKIYIEDYMRRQVGHSGTLHVGDQVTFSKTLIKNAIEKSKTLSPGQLENLKKYSARVSSI